MTFSVIRRAYTIVYRCFAEVMGIDAAKVHDNRLVFENMLGLFRGQVYYNLLNWYRVVRMFPGFEYNRAFMESMMGVRESVSIEAERHSAMRRYFVDLPDLLKLVLRSGRNFLRIRSLVDGFQANFRHHYDRWSKLDLDSKKPHELMGLYLDFEEKVLWSWRPPIINDFFVMIFYGVLKKLTAKWCGDTGGSLQNDLISGEGGIESTLPAKELVRLAGVARGDAALSAMILDREAKEALVEIRTDSRFAAFSSELDHYLDLYGFRCMNELKLEEPSLRDKPEFLITLMQNYLSGDPARLDLHAQEAREQEIRRHAEQRAFGAIRSPIRRAIFRRVLANARLGVKNRENMRFARTRIFGLVREVMRAIGRQFAAEGILDSAEDVFYLTLDEVFDFIKGTSVTTDLRGLVSLRRREFDGYRASEPPDDRFETFGVAYHRNRFVGRREAPPFEEGVLRGTACSPGKISGEVKVLRSPADAKLSGEILVAERTDPGWVPLYPSISGLLIERGSILSHSAIVAREMGIPTVVGIHELTKRVKSGDRVTMDGSTGVVNIEE
jgi:phosphohistidine swiveling domain-containing protein